MVAVSAIPSMAGLVSFLMMTAFVLSSSMGKSFILEK